MAKTKKKIIRKSEKAKVYISTSFNNTICTVVDELGNVLKWGSSGKSGFKGTKKSTPYAATVAVDKTLRDAISDHEIKEVEIYIKGPGTGRDSAIKSVKAVGLKITKIADVTPLPHNGPRPKKKRRV